MRTQRVLIAGLLIAAASCGSARAQGMPEHVQKTLSRFVGKWQMEDKVGNEVLQSDFEAEWSEGKATLNYRWKGVGVIDRKPISGFGTLGWDGKDKIVRERHFSSDGTTFEATHPIEADATQWPSPSQGTFAKDGKFVPVTGTRVISWKDDDEWHVHSKDRQISGRAEADMHSIVRRAKSEAARYLDYWKPMAGNWKTRTEVDGKPVEGTWSLQLAATKSCYVSSSTGGTGPAGHSVDGYEPALRAWKAVGFNDAGGSSTLIVHVANLEQIKEVQTGAKGTYEAYRSLADGSTEAETGNWSFPSWNGKQHILELTNVIKNGQPQPSVKIHYERQ